MDIRILKGDVTTAKTGFIVHGVNCQGVMGSGVAKTIKDKWPKVFDNYKKYCGTFADKSSLLGNIQPVNVGDGLYVVNLFSQLNYGRSQSEYSGQASADKISQGLHKLCWLMTGKGLPPECLRIHMPEIGGKRGGLNFDKDVMPLIELWAATYPEITFTIWKYDQGGLNA